MSKSRSSKPSLSRNSRPLEALLQALSAAGIDWTPDTEDASRATFPWNSRPTAVIRPASRDEAAAVVAAAGLARCPVHPISRGRNWGLGSRLPVQDAALIDLSRLDRILDLDETNGTARVEPGVTFEALQRALAARGLRHHVPGFGGPVDASVLANALERGEGAGPAGDRFAGLSDLEIALSTGERFRTGFGRFGDGPTERYHTRPAGPLIDGLFSQSGLGLALSGRVNLNPTLHWSRAFLFEFNDLDRFRLAIPVLQDLLRNRLCDPHDVAVWNWAKRVSSLAKGRGQIAEAAGLSRTKWGISIITASDHREVFDAASTVLERAFATLASEIRVADDRDAQGVRLETHLTGFSHGENVASVYAAKTGTGASPLNPDRDRCGFVWLCPVLPFTAEAILAVEDLIAEAVRGTTIFAALGMQAVSARAFHGYVSLAWDRDDTATDEQALLVHDLLATRLQAAGYGAFRLGHPTIGKIAPSPVYSAVIERLGKALDPRAIMSPGKIPR